MRLTNVHVSILLLCGITVFILASCTTPLLEKAFKPKMEAEESTEVIGEYCVSCHVHKDFEPEAHVKTAQARYSGPPYLATVECRVCHTYSKTWLLNVRRGTHWPVKK